MTDSKLNITFTRHLYDEDGDVLRVGIFLFIGEHIILRVSDIAELEDLIDHLSKIKEEISCQ